jgi:sugar lactone lactonase YvrE
MSGSDRKLETLVGGGAFFESPRWHDGRLWVSDYWRYQVVAIAPDGTAETIVQVSGSPSGLGWLPDGTLLVVPMLDRKLLRVQDGATMPYADLSAHSARRATTWSSTPPAAPTSAPSTSRPSPTCRPPTWSGSTRTGRCR